MPGSSYGAWKGGRDPLEAPFDVREALDELGESVLSGRSPRSALDRLLRHGMNGRRGLDALRQQARQRSRELRRNNRLDGTLEQIKQLLDDALAAERTALFPDPDDSARLAEAELDALPAQTSRAVRELTEYQWRSAEAAQKFQEIQDLLRSEILDSQFAGLKQAMQNATPEDLERIRSMMSALNEMLDADARGEHTQEQFDQFIEQFGDFFPENPKDLAELVDTLARRAAAAQRLMNSLTPEQRAELGDMMANMLGQAGLAEEMGRLQQGLRSARPDLPWNGRERMQGDNPMGYSEGTEALAELSDLDQIDELAAQNYPGASLADIDEELVERALGQPAVDDLAQLRRIEQELQRQGYVEKRGGNLTLTPRALRRLGSAALRRVFADIKAHGRGSHDMRDAGPSGELTGASRAWEFGDEQPLDVTRTVRNAVLRTAGAHPSGERGVRLLPEDFEVSETERRSSAAIALLVDMSFSMELRGFWGEAKTTALALHSLITTKYPQDAIQIIGFSDYARVMTPNDLLSHEWERVQGTNLQHGLMLARRHLDRHRTAEPVIMVVTDGEPTAHIGRDGFSEFSWPPTRETIAATVAEVARCTRRGATINVFMLDDEPSLVDFMGEVGRRNGGRLFLPKPGRLGEYVVADYLRTRAVVAGPVDETAPSERHGAHDTAGTHPDAGGTGGHSFAEADEHLRGTPLGRMGPVELRAELIDPRISRELRRSVLRPNQPPDQPLPGDDLADTVHIGVFVDWALASSCLIYPDPCPWQAHERPAWHLRAMATDPEHRGIGAGAAVLCTVVDYIAGTGGGILWCNARTTAVGFYRRQGLDVHGEEHLSGTNPPIPHFYMWLRVDAAEPASPEGVFEVADQILQRLDADRQANEVVRHLEG